MIILALDTSTRWMTAALWTDAGLKVELTVLLDRTMLACCPMRLDAMLREAGVAPADLTACAGGIGPGSYTGLRIGLSLMQGIAVARRIPLYGVASSMVLAAAVAEHPLVYVIQESGRRTGHAAVSAYDTTTFPPGELVAPRLVQPAELPAMWRGAGIVIGDAAARVMGAVPELGGRIAGETPPIPRASLLAAIASHRMRAKEVGNPAAAGGIYLAAPPLPQRKAVSG